jgi:hypothetical protein
MKLQENILNNEETYCEDCLEIKADSEFDMRFDFPICSTCSEEKNDTEMIYGVMVYKCRINPVDLDREQALDLFDELQGHYPSEEITITRKGK